VRKVAQYFYPQRQTQVMNEGWATFWHHHLLNTMYDDGHLADGLMIEWLKAHTNVVFQPPVGHPAYNGMNPYALGFAMYSDIKRICEAPTDEDRDWFPDIAGSDWLATLDHAMRNFKDESFIGQFLSPRVMRAFRLFADRRRREGADARGRGDPRRGRLSHSARGDVASVRPGFARTQHPGVERQPARRPFAGPAPHAAQRAPARTTAPTRCSSTSRAVGLPGASRKRRQQRQDLQ
jgi:hypothetical protein